MSASQLVSPNLGTAGNVGWCLSFVEAAFDTPHLYPYAFTAWEATEYKHEDQSFPDGMYVPIWFSYTVDGINKGHVAIRMPDGRILSSPWQAGTNQAILSDIAELERIYSSNGLYPLIYLGWSEDIAGVHVVELTPTPPPYTVGDITTKTIILTKDTDLWDFTHLSAISVGRFAKGYQETTAAIATQTDGTQFYLVGNNSTTGFNALDCEDYVPPPPIVSKPYTVPAAPAPVARAQTYTLLKPLMYFDTSQDAQQTKNGKGTLDAGVYNVWGTSGVVKQLSKDNIREPVGQWINTLDNVLPEVIPVKVLKPSEVTVGSTDDKWKSTYKSFHIDRTSDPYKTLQPITMREYSGKRNFVQLDKGAAINIIGTFVKDGITFYRPRANNDEFFEWYFGIPLFDDNSVPNLTKVTEDVAAVAERKLRDYYTYWKSDLHEIWDVFVRRKK